MYFAQFFQKNRIKFHSNIPTNRGKFISFQHPRFTGVNRMIIPTAQVVIQMDARVEGAHNSVPPGTYVTGQVSRMHLLSGCILGCAFSVYLLPLAS